MEEDRVPSPGGICEASTRGLTRRAPWTGVEAVTNLAKGLRWIHLMEVEGSRLCEWGFFYFLKWVGKTTSCRGISKEVVPLVEW